MLLLHELPQNIRYSNYSYSMQVKVKILQHSTLHCTNIKIMVGSHQGFLGLTIYKSLAESINKNTPIPHHLPIADLTEWPWAFSEAHRWRTFSSALNCSGNLL